MNECCLNCKYYICDYGYWFCRKDNDDERDDPTTYKCSDYKYDDIY